MREFFVGRRHDEYANHPRWVLRFCERNFFVSLLFVVVSTDLSPTARRPASGQRQLAGRATGASRFPNGTRLDGDQLTSERKPPEDRACPSDQLSLLRFTARLGRRQLINHVEASVVYVSRSALERQIAFLAGQLATGQMAQKFHVYTCHRARLYTKSFLNFCPCGLVRCLSHL